MTYFRSFCHYRGGIFLHGGGKILPVSHQECTILPLNSSGETNYYFLLDLSCVGLVRFENLLPTVVPICPDLQNETTSSTVKVNFRKQLVYLILPDFRG